MALDARQNLRKQARAAFKGGQYEESVAYYQRLVSEAEAEEAEPSPTQLQDRVELGTALFRVGRQAEAERELESVVEADPNNASAHHKLGLINLRLGRPQKALEALRMAASSAPKEAAYQWAWAELAIALGERDEAQTALDASLAIDPDNAEARAARENLLSQPPSAFGGPAVMEISDESFADLVTFIKTRPAEDVLPDRIVDSTYQTLFYVCAGSVAFLVIYLYVRVILIG